MQPRTYNPVAFLDSQGLATFKLNFTEGGTGLEIRTPCALISYQAAFVKDAVEDWLTTYDRKFNGRDLLALAIWLKEQEGEQRYCCYHDYQDLDMIWTFEAEKEEVTQKTVLPVAFYGKSVTGVKN